MGSTAIETTSRAYMREWRKKNKDKVRANDERFWKRKAEKENRTSAEEARRIYNCEYMREWRKKNKDKVRANNENYWKRKAEEENRTSAKDG